MQYRTTITYKDIVDEISGLNWHELDQSALTDVAWAYYYFSIQFRENLLIARSLYPDDEQLRDLERGECATDNLSPWPGVARPGEKMNHDEFMRRTLALDTVDPDRERRLTAIGRSYLDRTRAADDITRALSIASYEDGGLESVFRAILTASRWDTPLLQAFEHFLTAHILFDSDPDHGHGALCRHLRPDGRIVPLWTAFRDLFVQAAPALSRVEMKSHIAIGEARSEQVPAG